MFQAEKNSKFSKGAIGISKKEILIYSDMKPNETDGVSYFYHPVFTFPLKSIVSLVVSKLKKNRELKKLIRLDIFCKSMDDCKIIYKAKKDKKSLKKFIKKAKKGKVKTYSNVISFSLKAR